MNPSLRNLYRELIVEHSKQPHNFRRLGGGAAQAEEYNPLCGDRLTVYVELAEGVLRDVAFQGAGCAIATASASLMTDAVRGRSPSAAADLSEAFRALLTDDVEPAALEALGSLAAFAGVRTFPSRVACALVPWRALRAALHRAGLDVPAAGT